MGRSAKSVRPIAATAAWRLSAGVNLIHKDVSVRPGGVDLENLLYGGNDPESQAWVRSQWDIGRDIEVDLMVRAVDDLPISQTPAYVDADARIGWQATEGLEFALVGRNLFDSAHPEISARGAAPYEPRRSVYVTARATF